MKYDAKENYQQKKRNYELIKGAHELKPNDVSKEMLRQATEDLKFAEEMLNK